MQKSKDCEGCILLDCQGPIPSELNGEVGWDLKGDTDVLFVSEAPGRWETNRGYPFANPQGAGGVLRQSLKQMGISRFGIANTWRCRPPNNKLPEGEVPGRFCREQLAKDLLAHNQKITVPLGSVGLGAITGIDMSITKVQGRTFSTNFNGTKLLLLPMLHPAYLLRQRTLWRDWELGLDKLGKYLNSGELDYIPLSERVVLQAKAQGDAATLVRRLKDFKTIACDIETTSFNMPWEEGEIISVAFAWSPKEACAIPWRFVNGEVYEEVKRLFEDESIRWLWYNGPYDVQFLWAAGMNVRIDGDVMLETHLLDERLNVHSLKKDSAHFLSATDWEAGIKKHEIPNNTSEEAKQAWRDIPEDELLEYNGQDTTHTFHLSSVIRNYLGPQLCSYVDDLLVPTYNMLARARRVGIRVDMYKVKELKDLLEPVLRDIEGKLAEISGNVWFNANSPAQKLELLQRRGLKVVNTRKDTLEAYEGEEVVDLMRSFSEAAKMNSTYVVGIVENISSDLRIHPDWRMPTETGRPRCSGPNVLGMPRKAEESEHRWKRRIKEQFIADPNTLLMHIDRSQSEVRCACFLSGDEKLAEVLRSGRDLHGEVAYLMYGDGWTKEQRVWAKMVVFGLIYNREAPSLSRQLTAIARNDYRRLHPGAQGGWHIWSTREAQAMIDKFFSQMPRLKEWKKEVMAELLENWELTSFLGRKRRFGMINRENRKDAENEAVNFLPSSLSADINFLSCIETMRQFGKYGVEVLAPIHDAGLLRIPRKGSDDLVKEIEGVWLGITPKLLHTDLPFPVDTSVGERWSDL